MGKKGGRNRSAHDAVNQFDLAATGSFVAAKGALDAGLKFGKYTILSGDADAGGHGVLGTFTATQQSTSTTSYAQSGTLTQTPIAAPLAALGSPGSFADSGLAPTLATPGGSYPLAFANPGATGLPGDGKLADGTYSYTAATSRSVAMTARGGFVDLGGNACLGMGLLSDNHNLFELAGQAGGALALAAASSYAYDERGAFTHQAGTRTTTGTYTLHQHHADQDESNAQRKA